MQKEHGISFASSTTHITQPSAFTHAPARSVTEHALKLARFAYVRSQGNAPSTPSQDGLHSVTVIQTVALAIERALKDEAFSRLRFEQQEIAAAELTSQCMAGLRVVQALQGAMTNPYTMATQLKNNAFNPQDKHNVFDHIIKAHRPTTSITRVTMHEIAALPLGNA